MSSNDDWTKQLRVLPSFSCFQNLFLLGHHSEEMQDGWVAHPWSEFKSENHHVYPKTTVLHEKGLCSKRKGLPRPLVPLWWIFLIKVCRKIDLECEFCNNLLDNSWSVRVVTVSGSIGQSGSIGTRFRWHCLYPFGHICLISPGCTSSKVAKANISENYCSGCFPQSLAITAANVAIWWREN